MFCEKCGKPIADDSQFCIHCGAKVTVLERTTELKAEVPEPETCELLTEPTIPGTPTELAEQKPTTAEMPKVPIDTSLETIVEVHSDYYLPEFEKAEKGEETKFKWAAFLFGPMFCFYRKCGELFKKYFLIPYIILGVGLICSIVGALTFSFGVIIAAAVLGGVYSVWLFINSVRLGLNFNQEYYEHCKQEQNAATPKCGASLGMAMGFAVAYVVAGTVIIWLTLGAGLLGGSQKLDDFDYDAYYEEFGDSGESIYVEEPTYLQLMEDTVTYYLNAGTEWETPRLIIGSIDDYLYAALTVTDQVICEGSLYESEYGADYDFYDELSGGYLTITDYSAAHRLEVGQYGVIGTQDMNFSGTYYDYCGYQGY